MGPQPSAGYGINIEKLERRDEVLRVQVRLQTPAAGTRQAAVVTQPFILVQVPNMRGVKWIEVRDPQATVLATLPLRNADTR
jgi:hypothetical protein